MRSHSRYILSLLSNAVKESHEDSETYSSHGVYICTGWVFPSSADSGISVSDPRSQIPDHTHTKGRAGQRIDDSITYSLTGCCAVVVLELS